MISKDYTPDQALSVLIMEIKKSSPGLANHIRDILRKGKDGAEDADLTDYYTTPFSTTEAIDITLGVLRSYFIDYHLISQSANNNIIHNEHNGESNNLFDTLLIDTLGDSTEYDDLFARNTHELDFLDMPPKPQFINNGLTIKLPDQQLLDEQIKNYKALVQLLNF